MTIKRIFCLTAMVAASVTGAWAFDKQADSSTINIWDIELKINETENTVRLKLELDVSAFDVPRDRELILTPIIMASNHSDSLALEPIIVAGRNRWYHYLRNGWLDSGDEPIYRSGRSVTAKYNTEFDLSPWMRSSTLEMKVTTANCCDTPEIMPGESPNGMVPIASISVERPTLDVDYQFVPPVDKGPVTRNYEGSAFVTFKVNRTELKENYMDNRKELDKIINSIETVRQDKDATITGVHIKGFASPEGPYDNNVRLAQGRTETLRRYVRDLYHFADTTVTSSYEPEDWNGLQSYVADSLQYDIANRRAILKIIDSAMDPDAKNDAIMTQFPTDYQILHTDIYPWLRRSDYTIKYVLKIYTTLEEIRAIYKQDPTRLRAIDFYTLAQSYPVDSKDFNEVYLKGVEVYQDDPALNLNAANIALKHGELDLAQSYLYNAGNSAVADYVRGILAARRGDAKGALRLFEKAKAAGMTGIDGTIDDTRAIINYNPVKYFVQGTKNKQ